MKKQFYFIITLALSILILNSCENSWMNCIRGDEDVTDEQRDVDAFHEIELDGSFDVYINIGQVTKVIVEAEENLIDYIETRVSNGRLEIDTRRNRCIRNNEPMRIYVSTPSLDKIELNGSGKIECTGLATDMLEIDLDGSGDIFVDLDAEFIDADISGSGEIEFEGFAEEVDFRISGSGEINALDLLVHEAFATISGSGDMYLHVLELLDIKITGSGDVYYNGNPIVNSTITGSGNVHHW
jgi:hypothetical protein